MADEKKLTHAQKGAATGTGPAEAADGAHAHLTTHQNRKMLSAMAAEGKGEQLTHEQRKKSMNAVTAEGMSYSVMAGIGDAYVPAAAVALGASNFYIGLLTALPQLFGAALQFFALSALRILKNRKLLVMIGCLLHALTWLPVIALLLWPGAHSVPLIIFFFSLGAGFSLFVNPAWSSLVADIVPENERGGYFANRSRLMQFTLFAATFVAGFALERLEASFEARIAFAAVFVVAFLARLSSVFLNSVVSEAKYELQLVREIGMRHLFLLPSYRNELWFLAFVALMGFSSLFASPFFTPYLLNNLGYDVVALGILTATTVLVKILAFPYWGRIIDRFGNRAVLIAGAFTVPLVPFFWLFTGDLFMLVLINAFTGFVWAAYDLAVFNYSLSLVGRELRASFISKYNIFVGVFSAAGAIAGALFLQYFGSLALFGYSGILLVFLLSTVMRLGTALLFTPKLAGGREVQNTTSERGMIFDMVAVYPTQGAVQHVLGGWNFTRKVMGTTTSQGERMLKYGLGATGELLAEGSRKIMSRVSRRKKL